LGVGGADRSNDSDGHRDGVGHMKDISERLRRAAALGLIDGGLMEEAAAENERLRKNEELQMQRAIRAEAEVERLCNTIKNCPTDK